jgi:hypothetical protein
MDDGPTDRSNPGAARTRRGRIALLRFSRSVFFGTALAVAVHKAIRCSAQYGAPLLTQSLWRPASETHQRQALFFASWRLRLFALSRYRISPAYTNAAPCAEAPLSLCVNAVTASPPQTSAVLCVLAPLPLCVNAVTASPQHTQTRLLAPPRGCLFALTRVQFALPPAPVRQERRLRRYRSGFARKSRVRRTWSVCSHGTCAIGVSSKL